jgi:RNA polymerase-interacting CarD/CdnL/TRCF family regulator
LSEDNDDIIRLDILGLIGLHRQSFLGLAFFFPSFYYRHANCTLSVRRFYNQNRRKSLADGTNRVFHQRSDNPIKVVNMNLHVGDHVIHWVYGFGEILRQEEKNLPGQASRYLVVKVKDLTIWVPMDDELMNRLRTPTPGGQFEQLFEILSSPSEALSKDRFERKTHLLEEQKNASAEANCRIIRDLSSHQQETQLNDHDSLLLKQTRESLLSEWTYSLSVPLPQAELELYRLLSH